MCVLACVRICSLVFILSSRRFIPFLLCFFSRGSLSILMEHSSVVNVSL